ncbi:Cyclic di-GMP phosphodiesterase Gmr [Hartmannibacter diazotrophicus]|uniref:Cyclic di-GMP phosphodiesterase Gmr n=1 Tax=Hartmannibacter diazotrophicus TaxID=1482074 RepID=A0A2C9D966_9HYPH|nr:EAL domain-containing protein [Hartmannibacter diazotrophicus]SON56874.1 Cyclic di-GMP phosphodiesterase Gmr [Hartmannibacter diazotrophicus]
MTMATKQHGLADILRDLPVGLTVSSRSGDVLYTNARANAVSTDGAVPADGDVVQNNRVIQTTVHSIPLDEEVYTVHLSQDVTDQRALEDDLFQRAFFDETTGLPNRGLMDRSVSSLIEAGGGSFALAFIDLDGFKHINDYYGHTAGDQLLLKIADRLSVGLRPTDMLARVGGDEFVLLLSPIGDMETLKGDLEAVSGRLKEPFFIDGFEILSSASIGVSLFPQDGSSYDELRTKADGAMYRSKGRAKGSIQFFNSSVDHAASERARTEQRLRLAIRDRRLCCAYQPKVNFRTQDIVGVEVLLRWRDEDGLIQAPGDFIGLALELGLMDEVATLILDETIASMDRINEAFGEGASISINVAAKQAEDPRFMRDLAERLDGTGCPRRFMVEVTEEAFLARGHFQSHILPMLREVGAKVSIDDFGVGYSSLAALADITADEVKVDRTFITDVHRRPRSQSILKAIESLGQSLGMSVIVEGVETFEELAYLQAATRINFGQGYYFSKPLILENLGIPALSDGNRTAIQSRGVPVTRTSTLRRSG